MRHRLKAFAALVALAAATPAGAALCALDAVPAASLLLPYFEFDPACGEFRSHDTRLVVTNTHYEPVLAKVTLWSNAGVSVLPIDVYLNGYDQLEIDIGRIFCDGWLPSTGPALPPGPGRLAGPTVDFPSCNNTTTPGAAPVYGGDGTLDASTRGQLIAAMSGSELPLSAGMCVSLPNGRGTAEGYATVDAVNRCGSAALGDVQFETHLANNNVLIGSAVLEDNFDNSSVAIPVVPLEATAGNQIDFSPSFYSPPAILTGKRREPLPQAWSVDIARNNVQSTVDFVVWRSPPAPTTSAFSCASGPAWYPLGLDTREGYGARGLFHVTDDGQAIRSNRFEPFPRMTQRVSLADEFPEDRLRGVGWTYMNLSRPEAGTIVPAQAWVGAVISAPGRFHTMRPGTPVGDACDGASFDNQSPGPLQVGPGVP